MSVVIKGFDKPASCLSCPFNLSDCWCSITHGGIDRDYYDCDIPCPIESFDSVLDKPCEDAVSQKIDEFELKGKTAEIWIVKGKLQIRYLGAIHNIPLPPVTPKSRWIPVSEKLPEEYQSVLICGEGIVKCAQLIGGLFECDDMDLYGSIDGTTVNGAETFEVVAWMPLPEPYKEGENE